MGNIIDEIILAIQDAEPGVDCAWVEYLIDDILSISLCDDDISSIEQKYNCTIEIDTEKHNVLQYTFYCTIECDKISSNIFLEIEDGINNGTQLNDYSLDCKLTPEHRVIDVLVDVVLDESRYAGSSKTLAKAQAGFPRYKDKIITLLKNQSYDDYVTGGGTNKTDKHYKSALNQIESFGIYWRGVYKKQLIDPHMV